MRFPIEWCIDQIRRLWLRVDSDESGSANFLPRDGSLPMTGPLTLVGDPVSSLQAATKQYVDNVDLTEDVVFVFPTATNPWNLTHSKGRYPSACRVLIGFPSTTDLFEAWPAIVDIDTNNVRVDFNGSYTGRAILSF